MAQVYRNGRPIGTGRPHRPTPHEVRTHEFDPRRRGLDAEQVRAFQRHLADELALLHQELRALHAENTRLRQALRDWQATHTRPAPDQFRNNTGHW
ncbi:DivIVA domain-containing protein [Solwaraspora sp. WMMD1047]|uniref:DivIVA domain-containing protein n=1 Tax=Solwaraspora sp. WMMD1047 TaxID=3016102 RepID=UPI002415A36D|nr:DivIVA domain-containing protein [Solwaraspora sp. WMMD1047]MDG4831639.1 DivIVA domain-containing protein [Solwaraspora sp. WMMD1047]